MSPEGHRPESTPLPPGIRFTPRDLHRVQVRFFGKHAVITMSEERMLRALAEKPDQLIPLAQLAARQKISAAEVKGKISDMRARLEKDPKNPQYLKGDVQQGFGLFPPQMRKP